MQKSNDRILFSASDLTHFAECAHRTWLDRLHLDYPMEKTEADEHTMLLQEKGFAHEEAFFNRMKTLYPGHVEIDQKLSLTERVSATQKALHAGSEIIYQAALLQDAMIGTADFLLRVDDEENETWQYEVIDTKLAHSTKGKFILQLCFYSDLISKETGKLPQFMHVELGNGKRETFRVAEYVYYYRQLLEQFVEFLGTYPDGEPPYPVPCDHCPFCPWRSRCEQQRTEDDHLSFVANITRQQIARLESSGIRTLAQLAALPEKESVSKLASQTLQKLREQAKLQLHERKTGKQKAVVLPLEENEIRGFARLPEPDPGDLFFDMEGDPMYEGGLEYLFGIYYFDKKQPVFKSFWAHDREQEREAFIRFMDFVTDRLEKFPKLHIYHYAHYENTALKRLMSIHGVKEAVVDQLLREHRLVDLYKVVREGLRISKSGYSIKDVEEFYTEKRDAEVKSAFDSVVMYERWRNAPSPELLESIRQYNEADCRSTWQLREWLLSLRPKKMRWFSDAALAAADAKKPAREKSDKTIEHEKRLEAYHEKLVVRPANPELDPELAHLVDSLLDFYRRAAKPGWWNLFDRQESDFEDLMEDMEVIAALHSPELAGSSGRKSNIIRFRYPDQDFKVKKGDEARRLDNLGRVSVIDIDEDNCTVTLRIQQDPDLELNKLSISIGEPFDSSVMQNALFDFADALMAGDHQYKSVVDYLLGKIPDIEGLNPGEPIIDPDEDPLTQAISVVGKMQNTCLFIQGPPGSGKTYTGSHLIANLLRSGKRVAVSSNSHKAINNLLKAVDEKMSQAGANYFGIKKVTTEEQSVESMFIKNIKHNKEIFEDELPQLLAGTAWLLARSEVRKEYDYLFIDEAGQVSLANTVAMGMCADNLVLLGDQMQLGQPIQGVHPGRSGESALEYLLNGQATISPDRGIFLALTYRMHPDVCRFISDAIYESRLNSHEQTFRQTLILNSNAHPELIPTGVRYIPVEHDACSQRSEEEAFVVRELVDNLLTQHYSDGKGVMHPVTLDDILIVAPYNMQVNLLRRTLPDNARVGTVDKFQGQEAQVVIVSMATSSKEYLPRHIDFLYSKNRLNVAVSRAKCASFVIFNRQLTNLLGQSPEQISLINNLCHIVQLT